MDLQEDGTFLLDLADGRILPVRIRRSARARRVMLRLLVSRAELELVLPRGIALAAGVKFLEDRRDWIAPRLPVLAGPLGFTEGATVPVLGSPHRIRHRPGGRFAIEDGEIRVSGDPAHISRRVTDGLRARARLELAAAVRPLAASLGKRIGQIGIRDPRTRWGSCSGTGNLGFSWRLVMAPAAVLRYVAAHEVAHLQEMNHGPDFWRLVGRLHPGFEVDRDWLRRHGADLHRYG